jgi:hypothetical protein
VTDDIIETAVEVEELLSLASYELDVDSIFYLAEMLHEKRMTYGEDTWGCLHRGGSGVWCWLKSRMLEYQMLQECGGTSERTDRLVVELHFPPWDDDLYGPWSKYEPITITQIQPNFSRSPLSRLKDASPINKVARKIIQNNDHNCLYCNRYFRNPAALALHVKDFHGYD